MATTLDPLIVARASAKLLEDLRARPVAVDCLNRDYIGDLEKSDTVLIPSLGRPTINTWTRNADITAMETVPAVLMSMVLDQMVDFHFGIDQWNLWFDNPQVLDELLKRGAWGFNDSADKYAILTAYNGVSSATPDNLLTTRAVGIASGDREAYQVLVDLGTVLTKTNTPLEDRWAWAGPDFFGVLQQDPRAISFGTAPNRKQYEGGVEHERYAAGFRVMLSNNIYPALSSAHAVIAGHKMAMSFADKLTEMEIYSPQARIGTKAVKQGYVYGAKVTMPEAIAVCPITIA